MLNIAQKVHNSQLKAGIQPNSIEVGLHTNAGELYFNNFPLTIKFQITMTKIRF